MNREPHSPLSCASVTSNASSFYERFTTQERHSLMIRYPSIRDVQKASMVHIPEDPCWTQHQQAADSAPPRKERALDDRKMAPHYPTCSSKQPACWQQEAESQRSLAHDFLAARVKRSMHRSSPSPANVNFRGQGVGYHERKGSQEPPNCTEKNRHVICKPPPNTSHQRDDALFARNTTVSSDRRKTSPPPPPPSASPPSSLQPLLEIDAPVTIEIEISPGCFAPLRGSAETWQALQRGDLIETTCWVCQSRLQCIRDCSSVLCPDCRVISPLDDDGSVLHSSSSTREPYGIGLGLKLT